MAVEELVLYGNKGDPVEGTQIRLEFGQRVGGADPELSVMFIVKDGKVRARLFFTQEECQQIAKFLQGRTE